MSGRIPETVIADIRDRTDIVQVIGRHVELKRSGSNYKGLCPFHEEKTPSFNVNADRQFFHCFGCKESGDVIGFLMKLEGRRFIEVVEDLAQSAGVELERESPGEARRAAERRSERQQGLDLNSKVLRFYRALYERPDGHVARAYVASRGISPELAERFQLGYAPDKGSRLLRKLEQAGVPLESAVKLGLIGRRRGGDGYFDRFWNRLIFPLVGAGGEVLGFGGRTLSDDSDAPKYVNTPETALYRKGEALYGLDVAAKAMRSSDTCILVEGNLDVIQMHEHGFDNTVAPMGTALTERQVRLIRRFSSKVIALMDGDAAGRAAARRAAPTLVAGGVEARIAELPAGKDPDDLLREEGADAMRRILEAATPVIDYLVRLLEDETDDSAAGHARVLQQLAPVVARLEDPVRRALVIDRLHLGLRISREVVERVVGAGAAEARRFVEEQERLTVEPPSAAREPLPPYEADALAILLEHSHLFPMAEEASLRDLLTNDGLRATYSAAMAMQRASGRVDVSQLLQAHTTDSRVKDALARTVLSGQYKADGDPKRALDDCIRRLRMQQIEGGLAAVRGELARAEAAGDAGALQQLRERFAELMEQKRQQIYETR